MRNCKKFIITVYIEGGRNRHKCLVKLIMKKNKIVGSVVGQRKNEKEMGREEMKGREMIRCGGVGYYHRL